MFFSEIDCCLLPGLIRICRSSGLFPICLSAAATASLVFSGAQSLYAQAPSPSDSAQQSGSPEEIKRLVGDLGHKEYKTRESATLRLIETGGAAVPYLQKAVQSSDPEVRLRARHALMRLDAGEINEVDPVVFQQIDSLISPVGNSGHPNLDIVVKMGRKAAPSLAWLCRNGEGSKPIYSMIALTRISDPRSFQILAEMFQDSNINMHMPGYVAAIKDKNMLFHLIKEWQKRGDSASPLLRAQVVKMAGTDIGGDDPAKWLEWFRGIFENSR